MHCIGIVSESDANRCHQIIVHCLADAILMHCIEESDARDAIRGPASLSRCNAIPMHASHQLHHCSHTLLTTKRVFSRLLRVYTLNDREQHSWPSRVYILNGWGFSRPSKVFHQRPGGILPAVRGPFWLADPQNPVGFGALTPSPAGDFVFFFI
jgi:hypothetical protein